MFMKFSCAAALLFAALLAPGPAGAQNVGLDREEIRNYDVRIEVERDGGVVVTEDIEVVALGYEIRRGIYRDIPVTGRGLAGFGGATFELLEASRDGGQEPYRIERSGNSLRIYLGDADVFLKPGIYRYRIAYRMSDQVRRFDGFDEIYWNATGNYWTFPIENVHVVVVPPPGAPVTQLAVYTGYFGQQGDDAEIGETRNGEPSFRTTRPLSAGEGVTVAVGWPPGHLDPETGMQRLNHWMERWGAYAAAAFALGTVLIYYMIAWHFVGRDPRSGTIVPVYNPQIPPSAMRFIERMGFDNTCFAAAIVDLAVRGHLKISADKSSQKLIALDGDDAKPVSEGEGKLFDKLFARNEEVTIARASSSRLNEAASALKAHFDRTFNSKYFHRNRLWFALGVVITVIGWVLSAVLSARQAETIFLALFPAIFSVVMGSTVYRAFVSLMESRRSGNVGAMIAGLVQAIFLSVMVMFMGVMYYTVGVEIGVVPFLALVGVGLLNVVFWHLLKAPTAIGRAALDEIEGTRLYLTVAEEDRLKFHNPPDRTPEHFHELLPYAIALDVETAWTDQFRSEIESARAKGDGNPYLQPSWYSSRGGRGFTNIGQLRSVGASLGGAFASATAPRSSGSGSSGGGSSGGGGGGGGGGGW